MAPGRFGHFHASRSRGGRLKAIVSVPGGVSPMMESAGMRRCVVPRASPSYTYTVLVYGIWVWAWHVARVPGCQHATHTNTDTNTPPSPSTYIHHPPWHCPPARGRPSPAPHSAPAPALTPTHESHSQLQLAPVACGSGARLGTGARVGAEAGGFFLSLIAHSVIVPIAQSSGGTAGLRAAQIFIYKIYILQ